MRLTLFINKLMAFYNRIRFFVGSASRKIISQGRVIKAEIDMRRRNSAMPHSLPNRLVISLTSYPPRYKDLYKTLVCLLGQSMKPDDVILWIASEDMKHLPESILGLASEGLTISETQDLRSYKKIIPLIETDKNCFVVTADDDVFYPSDWLKDLVDAWDGDMKSIVCARVHKITFHDNGMPKPYNEWQFCIDACGPVKGFFPTGVGGVLYPPGVFSDEVTNRKKFMEICASADDVWLYWMARNGGRYRNTGKMRDLITWEGSQGMALWNFNQTENGNDACIHRMIETYGLPGHTTVE